MKNIIKNVFELLEFHWLKLIVPCILIVMFIFLVNRSMFYGTLLDKSICPVSTFIIQMHDYREANDTISLNETYAKLLQFAKDHQMESANIEGTYNQIISVNSILSGIDPFVPVPCEVESNSACRYYISKGSYDCFNSSASMQSNNSLAYINIESYKSVTFFDIILNLTVLFIEGYLVYSIILHIIKKLVNLKKKKQ